MVEDAADDHIQAAVRAHCTNAEDFERFYAELHRVPDRLATLEIIPLHESKFEEAARQGAEDEELIQTIRDAWALQRRGNKRVLAAKHDAALTTVAKQMRELGERCWVLTIDRTMQRLAMKWATGVDAPLWISLDTLLQVLAVEEEGSQLDAVIFAPLLAQLISNDVQACRYEYRLEDIQILDEIVGGAQSLPDHEVQAMARTVHGKRLAGADRTDPELQLVLNRMLQRGRHRLGDDARQSRDKAAEATRKVDDLEVINRQLRAENRKTRIEARAAAIEPRLQRAALDAALRSGLVWSAATAVTVALVYVLIDWAFLDAPPEEKIGLVATLGTFLIGVISQLWTRILPAYRLAKLSAPQRAIEIATEEIDVESQSTHGQALGLRPRSSSLTQ